jgi:U3 small nucleolar RNA-associated protein 22
MKLYSFLGELSPSSPVHPLDFERKLSKKGVAVPFSTPTPNEDVKWKVAFNKPSNITLAGSWANKVSVKGKDGAKFGVDLAIEMPSVSLKISSIDYSSCP